MKSALWTISALALCAVVTAQPAAAGVARLTGKTMPAWSVKTIDGKTLNNRSTAGKVVLLDFWASWCGPCKLASPTMEALHRAHNREGLLVVGANGMENKKGPEAARAYKAKHKYSYTMAYDTDALSTRLGLTGVPTFILIGRDGKVAYTATAWGPEVKANLENAVRRAVAAKR
jgi:thiol-disulfide isomerase/thioredoxin